MRKYTGLILLTSALLLFAALLALSKISGVKDDEVPVAAVANPIVVEGISDALGQGGEGEAITPGQGGGAPIVSGREYFSLYLRNVGEVSATMKGVRVPPSTEQSARYLITQLDGNVPGDVILIGEYLAMPETVHGVSLNIQREYIAFPWGGVTLALVRWEDEGTPCYRLYEVAAENANIDLWSSCQLAAPQS